MSTRNPTARRRTRIRSTPPMSSPTPRSASAMTPSMPRRSTPSFSRSFRRRGGNEANVAIGYHAIEFLLWGQDLNGTGPGAGDAAGHRFRHQELHQRQLRPPRGLSQGGDRSADRRSRRNGRATGRPTARRARSLPARATNGGLATILTGLGSLSYGELAGERMKLGLILHDPEEEHDCFSDNTHNSHYYDEAGMIAIYSGTLKRRDGSTVEGPGICAITRRPRLRPRPQKLDQAYERCRSEAEGDQGPGAIAAGWPMTR